MNFRALLTLLILFSLPVVGIAAGQDAALKDLTRFSDLASDFNKNQDKVRVVTLLSPT